MTRGYDSKRAIALVALCIDNHDLTHLAHPGRTIRKDAVQALRRNQEAIAPIPARGIEQQKVDGLQRPCGLLRQRVREVGDFAIVRRDGMTIRAPCVIRG